MAERHDLFLESLPRLLSLLNLLRCRRFLRAAGFEEFGILLLARLRQPVDGEELRQRACDFGLVEPQGDEAALSVERVAVTKRVAFELRPIRAERIGRQAQHQDARMFQPVFDLRGDAVAGFDLPLVKPDLQAIGAQTFGHCAHNLFVLCAVAEEYIVFESGHSSPLLSLGCVPLSLEVRLFYRRTPKRFALPARHRHWLALLAAIKSIGCGFDGRRKRRRKATNSVACSADYT